MIYDLDKFHRRSIRLKGYEYSKAGSYFITICSRNRECIFAGDIGKGLAPALKSVPNSCPAFRLTEAGKIIEKNWKNIAAKYSHIMVDDFVIMPNHIHGILIVDEKNGAPAKSTLTLGKIIGSFKSKCVIDYMKYCLEKKDEEIWKIWQRNYYEHVIRDKKELREIRKYILENPVKWLVDEDNPINIENNQKIGSSHGAPYIKNKTQQ
jgi:putative transposase